MKLGSVDDSFKTSMMGSRVMRQQLKSECEVRNCRI